MSEPIPFIDLTAQRQRLGGRIEAAIASVLNHGQFIMGPEVGRLEDRLAAFCGVKHCIACGNGTDALALVLMAQGIGPGDAVFVPAFTFVATAEAVAWTGATPVFVDVRKDTFNLNADLLEEAIEHAVASGLKPRAVIPVDLFGQPADYCNIGKVAQQFGLYVLADAAQSMGAHMADRRVGTFAQATATSFFPSKPLGCYGDGGAVLTDDDALAQQLQSLRSHGQGTHKYDNVRIGLNSRLDTIQAAILLQKLTIFEEEIAARQKVAKRYGEDLIDCVSVPQVAPGLTSVWAQYTIRVPAKVREQIVAALKERGIPTAVYYPFPLPQQTGYAGFPCAPSGTPVSNQLSREVMSLPMHAYLRQDNQLAIIRNVKQILSTIRCDSKVGSKG